MRISIPGIGVQYVDEPTPDQAAPPVAVAISQTLTEKEASDIAQSIFGTPDVIPPVESQPLVNAVSAGLPHDLPPPVAPAMLPMAPVDPVAPPAFVPAAPAEAPVPAVTAAVPVAEAGGSADTLLA